MYPQTTSLYAATVIDSTTYCREDDDIIVVEFDGEEQGSYACCTVYGSKRRNGSSTNTPIADVTGQVPQYHIPARFVTLIPREFPASQANAGANKKRKSTSQPGSASSKQKTQQDDFLAFDFGDGLGNFDALDLDFDKPLDEHEEQDAFPPIM